MALNLPDGLVTVVEFQHVKPGKGGAFVRTKLKNYRTGSVVDKTFRADEKVPLAIIDKREMQFLYREGADYVFMDTETYDQVHVSPSALGESVNYLKEGDSAVLPTYLDEVLGVELAASVELLITETEPGLQGVVAKHYTTPARFWLYEEGIPRVARQLDLPLPRWFRERG